MTRPTYQTPADLHRETLVAKFLQAHWDIEVSPNPKYYTFDCSVLDKNKEVIGLVEIKCRKNPHDAYDTYMVSASKWASMATYHNTLHLKVKLVVGFTDGIYAFEYTPEIPVLVQHRGRTRNPRDKDDLEPCVMIPMSKFQRLTTDTPHLEAT